MDRTYKHVPLDEADLRLLDLVRSGKAVDHHDLLAAVGRGASLNALRQLALVYARMATERGCTPHYQMPRQGFIEASVALDVAFYARVAASFAERYRWILADLADLKKGRRK